MEEAKNTFPSLNEGIFFRKTVEKGTFSKIMFQQPIALLNMTSYTNIFLQYSRGNTQAKFKKFQ